MNFKKGLLGTSGFRKQEGELHNSELSGAIGENRAGIGAAVPRKRDVWHLPLPVAIGLAQSGKQTGIFPKGESSERLFRRDSMDWSIVNFTRRFAPIYAWTVPKFSTDSAEIGQWRRLKIGAM